MTGANEVGKCRDFNRFGYFSTHFRSFRNLHHFKHVSQHCLSLLYFFAAFAEKITRDGDLEVGLKDIKGNSRYYADTSLMQVMDRCSFIQISGT